MNAPICFLDTETDGVHPGRKAWEIAMIRRESNGRQREEQLYVEVDLSTADPFGLRVGRFYDRHPLGRYLSGKSGWMPKTGTSTIDASPMVSSRDVAVTVAKMTHGAHIVGAVPNFDTEVLAELLRSEGLTPAWHYHLVDIENLAVGYLAGHGNVFTPPWKSDLLTEALGLEPTPEKDRHTAMGDTRWAMAVYDAVMRGGAA